MGVLERVSKLIHADIDELVHQAEHPEQLITQIVLDMQNQLMQLKTQVATAVGHERHLKEKQRENESSAAEWLHKAELAVGKKDDELARIALEHHQRCDQLADKLKVQIVQHESEIEKMKSVLRNLEQKLEQARTKSKMLALVEQPRKAKPHTDSTRSTAEDIATVHGHDGREKKMVSNEARTQTDHEMHGKLTDQKRLGDTEKERDVERMLAELKNKV